MLEGWDKVVASVMLGENIEMVPSSSMVPSWRIVGGTIHRLIAGDIMRPEAPIPANGNCITEDDLTGAIAVDDKEIVEDVGLKLDLRRCFRGTGFLRDDMFSDFPFHIN